jgi:hypothetical protein
MRDPSRNPTEFEKLRIKYATWHCPSLCRQRLHELGAQKSKGDLFDAWNALAGGSSSHRGVSGSTLTGQCQCQLRIALADFEATSHRGPHSYPM